MISMHSMMFFVIPLTRTFDEDYKCKLSSGNNEGKLSEVFIKKYVSFYRQ